MKVVLCQCGNVRSATTVAILRDCYGEKDVFAIGVETMTPAYGVVGNYYNANLDRLNQLHGVAA